jgi:hypothetical protein
MRGRAQFLRPESGDLQAACRAGQPQRLRQRAVIAPALPVDVVHTAGAGEQQVSALWSWKLFASIDKNFLRRFLKCFQRESNRVVRI